jgi:hypothetical protein
MRKRKMPSRLIDDYLVSNLLGKLKFILISSMRGFTCWAKIISLKKSFSYYDKRVCYEFKIDFIYLIYTKNVLKTINFFSFYVDTFQTIVIDR